MNDALCQHLSVFSLCFVFHLPLQFVSFVTTRLLLYLTFVAVLSSFQSFPFLGVGKLACGVLDLN